MSRTGLTRPICQGITNVRRVAGSDPSRPLLTPFPLVGHEDVRMNKVTSACLLLTLFASASFAGPLPQGSRKTSGENACNAGLKECKESLSDFKDAQRFMLLKATLLADLSRAEISRPTKPKITPASNAHAKRPETVNAGAYSFIVIPSGMSFVPAKSAMPGVI